MSYQCSVCIADKHAFDCLRFKALFISLPTVFLSLLTRFSHALSLFTLFAVSFCQLWLMQTLLFVSLHSLAGLVRKGNDLLFGAVAASWLATRLPEGGN